MGDSTSAYIFGSLAVACAKEGDAGKRIFKAMLKPRQELDFSDDEMEADKFLIELGFARRVTVEGEETTQYKQRDGSWE